MLLSWSNQLADAVARVTVLGVRAGRRLGSAFAVSEGRVVTAAHLFRKGAPVVLGPNGEPVAARLLGVRPALDVAVLEVGDVPPVESADLVRPGNIVLPVGFGSRVVFGLVSRVGRAWKTPGGEEVSRWVEVDGSLPHGFSGGPLLDAGGAVVGMNTHRLVRGGTTIPLADLHAVVAAVEEGGSRGFLGVGVSHVELSEAQTRQAGQSGALLVVGVQGGSPADGVLRVGDLILRANGDPVTGIANLACGGPGQEMVLDVLAGDQLESRTVQLCRHPADRHQC